MRVRVLWAYHGEREDDLTLNVGEIVEVVSAEGDWWVGIVGDRHGSFPSNYCEPIGMDMAPPLMRCL